LGDVACRNANTSRGSAISRSNKEKLFVSRTLPLGCAYICNMHPECMNARVKHIRCENYNHNQRSGRRRHRQQTLFPYRTLRLLLSSHAFCVCVARIMQMPCILLKWICAAVGARPDQGLNFIFSRGGSVGGRIIYFIMCELDSITARCHLHSPLCNINRLYTEAAVKYALQILCWQIQKLFFSVWV